MLYDFNMGYYGRSEINNPHSSIEYYPAENDYYHAYSLKEVGRSYSLNDLGKYLSLKEYVTLPNDELETILAGIHAGEVERKDLERKEVDNRRRASRGSGKNEKEMMEELKKLGLS